MGSSIQNEMGFQSPGAESKQGVDSPKQPQKAMRVAGEEVKEDALLGNIESVLREAKLDLVAQWVETLSIAGPSTPPPKQYAIQQPRDDDSRKVSPTDSKISPTDSKFSSNSVFDSPGSALRGTAYEHYAETEASSIDKKQEVDVREENSIQIVPKDSGAILPTLIEEGSLHDSSYNVPPLAVSLAPVPEEAFDPRATKSIWLSSCLQCVLADLPCSRTLPACSRCVRNTCGELCLVRRRPLHIEVQDQNGHVEAKSILLKQVGDDETVWQKKNALQEELLAIWQEKLDRANWVIPNIDSERTSDWRIGFLERPPPVHPGIGKGRLSCYLMQVAEWHPNAFCGRVCYPVDSEARVKDRESEA